MYSVCNSKASGRATFELSSRENVDGFSGRDGTFKDFFGKNLSVREIVDKISHHIREDKINEQKKRGTSFSLMSVCGCALTWDFLSGVFFGLRERWHGGGAGWASIAWKLYYSLVLLEYSLCCTAEHTKSQNGE